MFTLITASLFLLFIVLTGWTITAYLVKKESQQSIAKELTNLLNLNKMLFVSLKSLVEVLVKHSFFSDSSEETPADSIELDEQLSEVVESVEAPSFKVQVKEDEDTALSSFSPELIEVITEEEEKVA